MEGYNKTKLLTRATFVPPSLNMLIHTISVIAINIKYKNLMSRSFILKLVFGSIWSPLPQLASSPLTMTITYPTTFIMLAHGHTAFEIGC